MKRHALLESRITRAIMRQLREVRGVVLRKRHGTAMGVAGDPDIYGTFYGRHFEIEVKRPAPGSGLTEIQRVRLDQWRQAGALVGVATSAEEALGILFPPPCGVGQYATAYARQLVKLGVVEEVFQMDVANAIAAAIATYRSSSEGAA